MNPLDAGQRAESPLPHSTPASGMAPGAGGGFSIRGPWRWPAPAEDAPTRSGTVSSACLPPRIGHETITPSKTAPGRGCRKTPGGKPGGNNGIGIVGRMNHYCQRGCLDESLLHQPDLKIVFQQPQPAADSCVALRSRSMRLTKREAGARTHPGRGCRETARSLKRQEGERDSRCSPRRLGCRTCPDPAPPMVGFRYPSICARCCVRRADGRPCS